jgi:hypothetical protein
MDTNNNNDDAQASFVLQKVQPALMGLMDGSVSTLAPLFAAAGLTGQVLRAFFVGLAASAGAGINMGLAEALSDDGKITGRGTPLTRGAITGFATMLGGNAPYAAVPDKRSEGGPPFCIYGCGN